MIKISKVAKTGKRFRCLTAACKHKFEGGPWDFWIISGFLFPHWPLFSFNRPWSNSHCTNRAIWMIRSKPYPDATSCAWHILAAKYTYDNSRQEVFFFLSYYHYYQSCLSSGFFLAASHYFSSTRCRRMACVTQQLPLISSQHHTSSVIWPINKLQSGGGGYPCSCCRPLSTTGQQNMFQLPVSPFRLFNVTSVSQTNNHFY